MSMNPDVNIVLGIKVVSKQEENKVPKGTKYNEDTGKPYTVYETSYEHREPAWFAKTYKAQWDGECWVEEGEMGVIRSSDAEEVFLVGKLLKQLDPRQFSEEDIFSLDMTELLSKDRFEVLTWLGKIGAPNLSTSDIQLWVNTEWR